jgi:Tfp pilus assembly protein PilZ
MAGTERSKANTRRHRRQTVRMLVDYQCGEGVRCDYATTLGAGGMFLQTDLVMSRGDTVKVRFRIPGGELLHEFEARVTWYHSAKQESDGSVCTPGVGLQFTDPSAATALARELEDFCD